MKTIEEFYKEVEQSQELQKEFSTAVAQGKEAVRAFAGKHGCNVTEGKR